MRKELIDQVLQISRKGDRDAAKQLQERMREYIDLTDGFGELHTVGGVDVFFPPKDKCKAIAGVVVMDIANMDRPIETATASCPVDFPYIPRSGLLTYREFPAVWEAWQKLRVIPDILMFDGHGYAHYRRMGLATQAGILLDHPTIGVAKKILVGEYEEPPKERFASSVLTYQNEQVGYVLQTTSKYKPVFVSPGYKVSFESTLEIVKRACDGCQIPLPTRLAHNTATKLREKVKQTTGEQ